MVVVKFARQNVIKEQWLSFGTGIDILNKQEQGELKDSLDCLQKYTHEFELDTLGT